MSAYFSINLIRSILPFAFILIALKALHKLYHVLKFNEKKRELRNKVVLITGASSGIGEVLAHQFYIHGCKLILASRNLDKLNHVKEDLVRTNLTIKAVEPIVMHLDLIKNDSFQPIIKDIINKYGQIDILINNAGVSCRSEILEVNESMHNTMMQINYFGQVQLTNLVAKHMVERKSGHIVFMNSTQATCSVPYRFPYGAAKHALYSYADSLRIELHKYNINITSILPTNVQTSISLNALTSNGEVYGQLDPATMKGFTPKFVAEETLKAVLFQKNNVVLARFIERIYILLRIVSNPIYHEIGYMLTKKNTA